MSLVTTSAASDAGIRAGGLGVLRCAVCGSREPARTPARIHGWQRCRHCDSVIVAPWTEWEAFDGPNARTIVLERRGRVHFVVPRRTLLTSFELGAWLFIVNTIAAFCIGFFEVPPTPAGVWRWLGPLALALAGFAVSALFVRAWATVQHLEIGPQRIKSYRTLGTGRHARREFALGRGLEIDAEAGAETVSEHRFRVRLRVNGAKPVDLVLPTRREALWVATLVRRAADPEAEAGPRCGGCGAPLRVSPAEHAEGGVECAHCGAGFVVGARPFLWPRVAIPWPPGLPLPPSVQDAAAARAGSERAAPDPTPAGLRLWRRRGARGRELAFDLPREALGLRALRALALLPAALFFAGFGAGCLWVLDAVPEGSIGLPLYILSGAAMMFGISVFVGLVAALQLFARQSIGVDEASCWVVQKLGPLDLSRIPLIPETGSRGVAPVGWRASRQAVPLLRLREVAIAREGASTEFRLETPVRVLATRWRLPAETDRWLRRELASVLARRLRSLGREVALG